MASKDVWTLVNKCLVCGTKLVFLRSARPDAKPEEGSKTCSQNHAKFQVLGSYDETGEWSFDFILPARRKARP